MSTFTLRFPSTTFDSARVHAQDFPPLDDGPNVLLTGTSSADTLIGDPDFRTDVYAYGGNDQVVTFGGADRVDAGAGNDYVLTGIGNDLVLAGTGDDRLYGQDGNDQLYGGSGTDELYGGAGNDYIAADSGNDYLNGGSGNDVLVGGSGQDAINGGDGRDSIRGGTGSDSIRTGAGTDVVFLTTAAGVGYDRLSDFSHADDTFVLSAAETGLRSGWNLEDMPGDHFATSFGSAGAKSIVYIESTHRVYWDADGAGGDTAVLLAQLDGSSTGVDASDFFVS